MIDHNTAVRGQHVPFSLIEKALILLIFSTFAARFLVVSYLNISWDEFYFLSQVYEARAGSLVSHLQTLHVHFFQWLSLVSANEVDQIIAARIVMLALQGGTVWLIYGLCRRVVDRQAGLLAVLAYSSFSFSLLVGSSFRTDPIVTILLIGALYQLFLRDFTIRRLVFAGLLVGVAAMVTIKAAIYLPIFAVMFLLLLTNEFKKGLIATFWFGGSTLLAITIIYLWHSATMPADVAASQMVTGSFNKTVWPNGLFPRFDVLVYTLLSDVFLWLILFVGCVNILSKSTRQELGYNWWAIAAMILPLGAIFIYRNAFAYFYPFMMAPAIVIVAFGWTKIRSLLRRALQTIAVIAAMLVMMASVISKAIILPTQGITADDQRQLLAEIHKIFPEPVTYIDRNSMVSSFPKVGPFLSTWGLESYRAAGQPVYGNVITERQPQFLLLNSPAFAFMNGINDTVMEQYQLLSNDKDILKATYIHHWGPVYVPGILFDQDIVKGSTGFIVSISGDYVLEGRGAALIDGKWVAIGDAIFLDAGEHVVNFGVHEGGHLLLRWGKNLYKPEMPYDIQDIYGSR